MISPLLALALADPPIGSAASRPRASWNPSRHWVSQLDADGTPIYERMLEPGEDDYMSSFARLGAFGSR